MVEPRGVEPKRVLNSPPRPGVRLVHCSNERSNSFVGVEAPYFGVDTGGKSRVGAAVKGEELPAIYEARSPEKMDGSHCFSVRLYRPCRDMAACADGVDVRADVSEDAGRESAMMMLGQRHWDVTWEFS